MMIAMKTSNRGIALIKELEGYRDKAYKCEAGVLTCGYGHTQGVKRDTTCTPEIAEQWLREDIQWAERVVNELQGLAQCQFDALVSFVYNIGSKAFRGSTAYRLIKENPDDPRIANAMRMWNKVTINGRKETSKGLTNRREKEIALYYGR